MALFAGFGPPDDDDPNRLPVPVVPIAPAVPVVPVAPPAPTQPAPFSPPRTGFSTVIKQRADSLTPSSASPYIPPLQRPDGTVAAPATLTPAIAPQATMATPPPQDPLAGLPLPAPKAQAAVAPSIPGATSLAGGDVLPEDQDTGEIPGIEKPPTTPADTSLLHKVENFGGSVVQGLASGVGSIVRSPIGQGVVGLADLANPFTVAKALGGGGLPDPEQQAKAIGDAIGHSADGLVDPALKDTIGSKAGGFLGGAVPYIAAGLAGPEVLLPTLFSGGYQDQFEAAKQKLSDVAALGHPVDPDTADATARRAGLLGGVLNTVLRLPFEGAAGAVSKVFGGADRDAISRTMMAAFQRDGAAGVSALLGQLKGAGIPEAAQKGIAQVSAELGKGLGDRALSVVKTAARDAAIGAAAQTGQNVVAQNLYDPERGTFEGVPEQAAGFGLLGAAAEGARQVTLGRRASAAKEILGPTGSREGNAPPTIPNLPRPGDGAKPVAGTVISSAPLAGDSTENRPGPNEGPRTSQEEGPSLTPQPSVPARSSASVPGTPASPESVPSAPALLSVLPGTSPTPTSPAPASQDPRQATPEAGDTFVSGGVRYAVMAADGGDVALRPVDAPADAAPLTIPRQFIDAQIGSRSAQLEKAPAAASPPAGAPAIPGLPPAGGVAPLDAASSSRTPPRTPPDASPFSPPAEGSTPQPNENEPLAQSAPSSPVSASQAAEAQARSQPSGDSTTRADLARRGLEPAPQDLGAVPGADGRNAPAVAGQRQAAGVAAPSKSHAIQTGPDDASSPSTVRDAQQPQGVRNEPTPTDSQPGLAVPPPDQITPAPESQRISVPRQPGDTERMAATRDWLADKRSAGINPSVGDIVRANKVRPEAARAIVADQDAAETRAFGQQRALSKPATQETPNAKTTQQKLSPSIPGIAHPGEPGRDESQDRSRAETEELARGGSMGAARSANAHRGSRASDHAGQVAEVERASREHRQAREAHAPEATRQGTQFHELTAEPTAAETPQQAIYRRNSELGPGIHYDLSTRTIVTNPARLADAATVVREQGGNSAAWHRSAVEEELHHDRQRLAEGSRIQSVYEALWKTLPMASREVFARFYHSTTPWVLGAEYERAWKQRRDQKDGNGDGVTEAHFRDTSALNAVLDAPQPAEIEAHLAKVQRLTATEQGSQRSSHDPAREPASIPSPPSEETQARRVGGSPQSPASNSIEPQASAATPERETGGTMLPETARGSLSKDAGSSPTKQAFDAGDSVTVGGRAATVESVTNGKARVQLHQSGRKLVVPVGTLRPKVARSFTLPHAPLGTPDILDHIAEQGGILSRTGAQERGSFDRLAGDYDGAPELRGIYNASVYGGKMTPDRMAQFLHDEYTIGDGLPDGMWKAIEQAVSQRRSIARDRRTSASDESARNAAQKQTARFERDASTRAKGDKEINTVNLRVGDVVTLEGEKLKVTDIDPDTLDVTLQDHSRYGVQKVEAHQALFVEQVRKASKGSAPAQAATTGTPRAPGRESSNQLPAESPRGQTETARDPQPSRGAAGQPASPEVASRSLGSRALNERSAPKTDLPTLRRGENQGDLLSKQTEDLALVGEKGIDHEARQRAQEQDAQLGREAQEKQDREQQSLFAAQPGRAIAKAYTDLVDRDGFKDVRISDLAKESGLPLATLKPWIVEQARAGNAIPTRGDESLASPEGKAAAVEIRGEPHFQVRLDDRALHAATPRPADQDEAGFTSQLARTISAIPQETMNVAQAKALITKGSKPAEQEFTGILTDPLSPLVDKPLGAKVTRMELLDYAVERQAKTQQVTLGSGPFSGGDVYSALDADWSKVKEGQSLILPGIGDESSRRIYEKGSNGWTVREEQNGFPTEVVGQLNTDDAARDDASEWVELHEENGGYYLGEQPLRTAGFEKSENTHFSQYSLPGADEGSYREAFVTWPIREAISPILGTVDQWPSVVADGDASPDWFDGHSQYAGIANPITRLRYNTRTDADGKKTLFLEEIQGPSDANQQKMPEFLRKRIYEIGIKRALRIAADEGADSLSWTTGEQQAERYYLSKQISGVNITKNKDGEFAFSAWDKSDAPVLKKTDLTAAELAEHVGKDLAARARSQEPNEQITYSGLDLKTGGEGLKNLYDRMLPRIANDLVKKFGVKVGEANIGGAPEHPTFLSDVETSRMWDLIGRRDLTPSETAERDDLTQRNDDAVDGTRKDALHTPVTVHSLPLPAALREHVQQGQNLFAANPFRVLWEKDLKPTVDGTKENISDAAEELRNYFTPQAGADMVARDLMGEFRGAKQQHTEYLHGQGKKVTDPLADRSTILGKVENVFRQGFDRMSRAEQVAFVDRYKTGKPQPTPELKAVADTIRRIDTDGWKAAKAQGIPLAWLDDHYRVMWKIIPGSDAARENLVSKFNAMPKVEREDFQAKFTSGATQPTEDTKRLAAVMVHLDINPDWKKPEDAPEDRDGASGAFRRPVEGDKGMLKRHSLNDMSEGLLLGGEPHDYNPWRNFERSQASLQQLTAARRMWNDMKTLKRRVYVPTGAKKPPGYDWVDDKIASVYFKTDQGMVDAGKWAVESGLARLINRHLAPDMLRSSTLLRGLLATKNFTTALELALSPFHFIFVSLDAAASSVGLGLQKIYNRGFLHGDVGALREGLHDLFTSPLGMVQDAKLGSAGRKAIGDPGWLKTPEGQGFLKKFPDAERQIQEMFAAGMKLSDNEWEMNARRAFAENLNAGNYIGSILRVFPTINETLMEPLFKHYIPNIKVGAFLRDYSNALAENTQQLADEHVTRLEIARRIVRFNEDRFGEMNYDNLYWDRTFKSAMQLFTRSVTWKLGSATALYRAVGGFGGGAGKPPPGGKAGNGGHVFGGGGQGDEMAAAMRERRAPRLHRNAAWFLGLCVTTAVMAATIQKLLSGKNPGSIEDLVYPQIDASDDKLRVGLPTYLKDVVHLAHSPSGFVTSSLAGWIGRVAELWQNKDFYGTEIRHPDDPLFQQIGEALNHEGKALLPFSVTGYQKLRDQDVSALRRTLALAGLNPAPKYITDSPAEQKAHELMINKLPQGTRTQEQFQRGVLKQRLRIALSKGDQDRADELIKQGHFDEKEVATLRREAQMTDLQRATNRLSLDDLAKVEKVASVAEKQELAPILERKIAAAQKQGRPVPLLASYAVKRPIFAGF